MAASTLLPSYQSSPTRIELLSKPSHRVYRTSQVLRISSHYTSFEVRDVSYRPPGTQQNLLNKVSFSLPEKSFGLIFGRSGSGKTTLLQILAGFSKPTSGSIHIQRFTNDGKPLQPPEALSPQRVGIVFQFPERYFLTESVLEEVTFGWPRLADFPAKEKLASRLEVAFRSVGMRGISLDSDPHSLSGGFKRRLALAIQLVQKPDLLLLDEPLAGLDWKARADVVKLIKQLKRESTILVVSHDLKYKIASLENSGISIVEIASAIKHAQYHSAIGSIQPQQINEVQDKHNTYHHPDIHHHTHLSEQMTELHLMAMKLLNAQQKGSIMCCWI